MTRFGWMIVHHSAAIFDFKETALFIGLGQRVVIYYLIKRSETNNGRHANHGFGRTRCSSTFIRIQKIDIRIRDCHVIAWNIASFRILCGFFLDFKSRSRVLDLDINFFSIGIILFSTLCNRLELSDGNRHILSVLRYNHLYLFVFLLFDFRWPFLIFEAFTILFAMHQLRHYFLQRVCSLFELDWLSERLHVFQGLFSLILDF